mmetsp:Transcript_64877/g.200940  ORF Transcript_64877/g.200940 Transcript_64877/m.200940 type:complete len:206 (+) Transcript_64877:135-752(+)
MVLREASRSRFRFSSSAARTFRSVLCWMSSAMRGELVSTSVAAFCASLPRSGAVMVEPISMSIFFSRLTCAPSLFSFSAFSCLATSASMEGTHGRMYIFHAGTTTTPMPAARNMVWIGSCTMCTRELSAPTAATKACFQEKPISKDRGPIIAFTWASTRSPVHSMSMMTSRMKMMMKPTSVTASASIMLPMGPTPTKPRIDQSTA